MLVDMVIVGYGRRQRILRLCTSGGGIHVGYVVGVVGLFRPEI
jgi:hypothetical protein